IGWMVRQGTRIISHLGRAVLRYRQANVLQPDGDEPPEPLRSPGPTSTLAVVREPKSHTDSMAPSASQAAVPPVQPSATTVSKRQLGVPILPTLPAATSPVISAAKS